MSGTPRTMEMYVAPNQRSGGNWLRAAEAPPKPKSKAAGAVTARRTRTVTNDQ